MAELPPIPPLPPAHLVIPDLRHGSLNVSVNASVTHVTPEAAKAMVDVAVATHVTPKRVVMRYTLAGTALSGLIVGGILWLTYAAIGTLPWQAIVGGMVVVAAPFGVTAVKVIPKMMEQAAGGGAS